MMIIIIQFLYGPSRELEYDLQRRNIRLVTKNNQEIEIFKLSLQFHKQKDYLILYTTLY